MKDTHKHEENNRFINRRRTSSLRESLVFVATKCRARERERSTRVFLCAHKSVPVCAHVSACVCEYADKIRKIDVSPSFIPIRATLRRLIILHEIEITCMVASTLQCIKLISSIVPQLVSVEDHGDNTKPRWPPVIVIPQLVQYLLIPAGYYHHTLFVNHKHCSKHFISTPCAALVMP